MRLRVWNERVVPWLIDRSLRIPEVGERRARVCPGLHGAVLEVGFGSGLNVRWYPDTVTSVTAIEPSDHGWRLSRRRRQAASVPIERAGLDGQALDLPTASHDSALVTYSLCTFPDPDLALREIRRVVRPGGRLHFLEHGVSPEADVRRWQRRIEPMQRRLAGGCRLTRDPLRMLAENGWETQWTEQEYLPGPRLSRPLTFLSYGVAG